MLTLSALKSEITADKNFNTLDSKSWEVKLHERAVDVKFDDVLEKVIPMYVRKIEGLRSQLMDDESGIKIAPLTKEGKLKTEYEVYQEFCKKADEYHYAQTKEQRLLDKLACCLKEQELRKANLVTRTPHHTTYYCDYTNGNNANDGLSADNAHSWKTINKYTTTTVRTAGDILLVRANQTHDCSAADIVFDEDGDLDNWIYIIGCDATVNDPWNDDSNVNPIFDFGDASKCLTTYEDKYWWFENIEITKSGNASGAIQVGGSSSALSLVKFKSCNITNGKFAAVEGLYVAAYAMAILDGCVFSDTSGTSIYNNGTLFMYNCELNSGASKPPAIAMINTSIIYAYNCSFGITTQFTTAIVAVYNGTVYFQNCTYDGTLFHQAESACGQLVIEDDDAVYGSHVTYSVVGTISKQTASPRSGGSTSYAQMTSNSNCGPNLPLILGHPMSGFSPKWLTKDIEYIVTVYARVGSAWDSALSANETYLKVSYLSNASSAARTEVQSTETITNDGEWTAFTVTFTPLQTGFVYFWFYLAEYEDASEYIDVDDEPVVS